MHTPSKWILALGALTTSGLAQAELNIFACQPDWAALAQEHAPEANVFSATTAMQDPHYVQARPSLISKMRKADLVICSGAELEVGWLPELQRQSRNRDVQNGRQGLFWTTDYANVLDKHDHVDRSMGDVHAHGNPHVQFAVPDMIEISRALSDRLSVIDADNAVKYKTQGVKFRANWRKKMTEWEEKAAPLKGMEVVGYHSTHRYLFAWLNIEQVADLEPKPGLPPTIAHLNRLAQQDFSQLDGIVYSSHQPVDAANWLSQRTQASVVQLAQSVGGRENTDTLSLLIDDTIDQLLKLKEAQ